VLINSLTLWGLYINLNICTQPVCGIIKEYIEKTKDIKITSIFLRQKSKNPFEFGKVNLS